MTEGQHYYSSAPDAAHRPGEVVLEIAGRRLLLGTDAGVFSRSRVDRGTRLMIETLARGRVRLPEEGTFCDLGCGYGPIGLALAVLYPAARVHMVDVNERAVGLARDNARRNGIGNVDVQVGSGMSPFAGLRFHAVISNPPLRIGKDAVYALLAEGYRALHTDGSLLVVIRTQQGARSMERYLQELGGPVREVDKGGGFRVYEARRA